MEGSLTEPVVLSLSHAEALVLFEFFERNQDFSRLKIEHPAEEKALMRLSAQLDTSIADLFEPGYQKLLSDARQEVLGG